jgi:hypothetical protein
MKWQLHLLAAMIAVALLVPGAAASAVAEPAALSSGHVRPAWIQLHRPDGEIVHINTEHVVFVMSAANSGADKRAQSKLQLVNGFCDVRESVAEVMRLIRSDAPIG